MSADFICRVLEFPKIRILANPDWAKAKQYIRGLPDAELASIINELRECSFAEDEEGFVEAILDNLGTNNLQKYFLSAVDKCEEMWKGDEDGTSVELSNSTVLISADHSWIDRPEGYEEMGVFAASGAAEVAGFILK